MYKDERRAYDTINRRARRCLFVAATPIVQNTRATKLQHFLAKFEGEPVAEEAFRKLLLNASIAVVKRDLADTGRAEPSPYFAVEAGLQIAQTLLAERDERARKRRSFEPKARVLELIVLACWEVQASRPSKDLQGVPASLATDVAVANALGLELINVQTSVNSAKCMILSGGLTGAPIMEAWKAFHARALEVWPAHLEAVEGAGNAEARP